jgi:hypothetical protein
MMGGASCPSGSACTQVPGLGNSCVVTCMQDSDCRTGYNCMNNYCAPAFCFGGMGCPMGETCVNNVCQ